MTPKGIVRVGQSHVCVHTALNHVPVHADEVGRRSRVPDKNILRGKSTIADDVQLIAFDLTRSPMAIQDAGSISEEVFKAKAPYLIPTAKDATNAGTTKACDHTN